MDERPKDYSDKWQLLSANGSKAPNPSSQPGTMRLFGVEEKYPKMFDGGLVYHAKHALLTGALDLTVIAALTGIVRSWANRSASIVPAPQSRPSSVPPPRAPLPPPPPPPSAPPPPPTRPSTPVDFDEEDEAWTAGGNGSWVVSDEKIPWVEDDDKRMIAEILVAREREKARANRLALLREARHDRTYLSHNRPLNIPNPAYRDAHYITQRLWKHRKYNGDYSENYLDGMRATKDILAEYQMWGIPENGSRLISTRSDGRFDIRRPLRRRRFELKDRPNPLIQLEQKRSTSQVEREPDQVEYSTVSVEQKPYEPDQVEFYSVDPIEQKPSEPDMVEQKPHPIPQQDLSENKYLVQPQQQVTQERLFVARPPRVTSISNRHPQTLAEVYSYIPMLNTSSTGSIVSSAAARFMVGVVADVTASAIMASMTVDAKVSKYVIQPAFSGVLYSMISRQTHKSNYLFSFLLQFSTATASAGILSV